MGIKSISLAATTLLLTTNVNAATILFVSDSTTDTSIATVLSGAGHTVTSSINQYSGGATTALLNNLSSYDAVYWSATGTGYGSLNNDAAMFSNLNNYVSSGGDIFVTGYDSISSPTDTSLMAFLGGSTNRDDATSPGVISNVATSITTGVEDIRGLIAAGTGNQTQDRDSMGGLNGSTIGLVESANVGSYFWTLQSLGLGEIAYVSNGNHIGMTESESWADVNSSYNAAILNFAYNSTNISSVPVPAAVWLFGSGLLGLIGVARRKKV